MNNYVPQSVQVERWALPAFAAEKNAPLFRTLGGLGPKQFTGDRMSRQDARRTIVRRAHPSGSHSFRATGITVYLLNGGLFDYAQQR
jgi:hypothetical protein